MPREVSRAAPASQPTWDSWDIEHWPPGKYPHTPQRAKYLVRAYRDELILAGAVTRVGRELVILGTQYDRWLQRRRANVSGFKNGAAVARDAAP